MSEPVDHKGYPTKPRQLDELSWFYEGSKGLVICQQPRRGVDCVSVTIPWQKVIKAVDRHFKAKRKNGRAQR